MYTIINLVILVKKYCCILKQKKILKNFFHKTETLKNYF